MKDQIIAQYTSTRSIPSWAKGATITVDAKAYSHGDQSPYFSITAMIYTPASRRRNDCDAGGCLHDEILRLWPNLKPLVDLHLSDAVTGAPMHAEANGWHWCAKAAGIKQPYEPDQSPEKCLEILAKHLRMNADNTTALVRIIQAGRFSETPREYFSAFVKAQSARWEAEAKAGIALIEQLNAKHSDKLTALV